MPDVDPATPAPDDLTRFGRIDIYLFDQLLRGTIGAGMRILDAGCGPGRNVEYLLRAGAEVHGVDADPAQVERIRAMAVRVAPETPPERFGVHRLDALPYPDGWFGAVICNAVLHFSEDEAEFEASVAEMWRVLAPGGVFFARLASTIGMEALGPPLRGRWYHLPDGSDRFLVDEAYLGRVATRLGATQLDPLKTTVVQGMRAMTTWVLRKG